jgi:prepilin-type N-terminal cleavage/methylation domain-containing protein
MRKTQRGFTLLEVLLALLLISVGLLGLLGTLGPIARLSSTGRIKGRIALLLESRLDLLRAELLRAAPSCVPPAGGAQAHPEGISEAWRAVARPGGLIELSLSARSAGSSDSLVSWLRCP